MDFILFPFHKVSKGERVAIYGAGDIFQQFKQQIAATNYCEIGWLIDRKFESNFDSGADFEDVERYSPTLMDWSLPRKIIIASIKFKCEINNLLHSLGVSEDRIVTIDEKSILKSQDRLSLKPDGKIWQKYYENAELYALDEYEKYISPILNRFKSDICFDTVLDFACGKGRIAELFKSRANNFYLIDAGNEAIQYCQQRFINDTHVKPLCNNSGALPIDDSSVTFIYSWDAMVHFSYKSLDFYLSEFNRVAKVGAYILIHHSNLGNQVLKPAVYELWSLNPGGRANVTKEDLRFIASHYGMDVIEQNTFNWAQWNIPNMDCVTVLKKR